MQSVALPLIFGSRYKQRAQSNRSVVATGCRARRASGCQDLQLQKPYHRSRTSNYSDIYVARQHRNMSIDCRRNAIRAIEPLKRGEIVVRFGTWGGIARGGRVKLRTSLSLKRDLLGGQLLLLLLLLGADLAVRRLIRYLLAALSQSPEW